ncbi:MAG: FkbM family methyltransferase [Bryobacterales bacterium]|nr:FkbM family methyltransferase [Bryobacterales bacterium]
MWAIRRLFWPIFRQYHFFQVEQMAAAVSRLDQYEERLNRLDADSTALAIRHREVLEEVPKASVAHFQLATDLAAVVNRQAVLEQDSVRLLSEIVSIRESLAAGAEWKDDLASSQAELAGRQQQLADHLNAGLASLQQQETRLGQQEARLELLDHRTKLALATSPTGLFVVKVGDLVSDTIAATGVWDPHVLATVEEVARTRHGVAIDAGAHIGFMTVAMAARFSRVLSFEPNSFNYQLLSANVALNGCGNVTCIQEALFSHETQISLAANPQQEIPMPLSAEGAFDGLGASNLGAYSFVENGSGLSRVRARALDSFQLADVGLIKIDVQGADGEVLAGARDTLARCRPVVVFEWEELLARNFGVSFQTVVESLNGLNYKLEVLKRSSEKQVDYIARPL